MPDGDVTVARVQPDWRIDSREPILDIAMFTCGQFRRAQENTMILRRDIS